MTNQPDKKSNISTMPKVIPGGSALDTPHSEALERAVLAAMFTYPGFAQRMVAEIGNHNVFFYMHHKIIYDAIAATLTNDTKPDTVTVLEKLMADGNIAIKGCQPSDITTLLAEYRTEQTGAPDLDGYIYGLKDYYQRWEHLKVADEIKKRAYDMSANPKQAHYNALEELSKAGEFVLSDVFTPIGISLQRHAEHTEDTMKNDRRMTLPTNIDSVDNWIEGLEKQKVCVIAGRKQNGKTSLSLSAALNIAKTGARVVIFNVADGNEHDVLSRLIAMEGNLSYKAIRTGRIEAAQYGRYIEAMQKIRKLNLTVRSVKGMNMKQLQAEARGLAGINGIDLMVIDYIQRLTVDTSHPKAPRDRVTQLAHISQSITKVAEDLDTAMIVAAQINRDGDGKMPSMANIKGCGAIEEDADVVMLVHRDSVYDDMHPFPQQIQVKIAANKQDGRLGTALVKIDPLSTYIRSK
jgi:replicative DNA helicase